MQVLEISIDLIDVGKRRRVDFGDIPALANGINRVGLLEPIIVDHDGQTNRFRLVSGERRLKAARMLQWKTIPGSLLEHLSDEQLRDIELEENENRKGFTEQERAATFAKSKRVVESVTMAEEVFAVATKTSNPKGGRPPKREVSRRQVAEALGVSEGTLRNAEQQVTTAERFSYLQTWRQADVLRFEQYLRKVPEEERTELGNFIGGICSPMAPSPDQGLEVAETMTMKTPESRVVIYHLSKSSDRRERDLAIARAVHRPPTPDARISILQNVLAELIKAVKPPFDKDPEVQELRVIGRQIDAIRRRLRGQCEQTIQKEEEDLQTDLRATR